MRVGGGKRVRVGRVRCKEGGWLMDGARECKEGVVSGQGRV